MQIILNIFYFKIMHIFSLIKSFILYLFKKIFLFIKFFILFASKKIHMFFINFNQMHFIYLSLLWLLLYLKQGLFSTEHFKEVCLWWVKSEVLYCSFFEKITTYLLVPEIIILWIMSMSLLAVAKWLKTKESKTKESKAKELKTKNKDKGFKEVYFLWIVLPFLLLRIFTSKPSDNGSINFFNEHYVLVWEYWIWLLIIIFLSFIMFNKEDFSINIAKKPKKTPILEEIKENRDEDKAGVIKNNQDEDKVGIIKDKLPLIIEKILYSSFKKVSFDAEGNKKSWLCSIEEVIQEKEEEYFVVLDLHEDLFEIISSLSNYKWTLWIESLWNIPWFKKATWKSKAWKNGVVLNVLGWRINLKATFKFPNLLVDEESVNPLDFKIWIDEKWNHLVYNLWKFPHLLTASETWGWKSVALNNLLVSCMKNKLAWHPIRFFIVDPKMVEFSVFEWLKGFHISTSIDKGLNTAKWLVSEMYRRYDVLKRVKVKNIKEYHWRGFAMDYLLFIVDEFADIMTSGWETAREFETAIVKLTQLARAVWIHVVLATQNPIWEVITSNIKANMTSRLWLRTSDSIKSRTIIDSWVLADIKYPWEWYMKTWEWMTHFKSYYIDNETELADFIAYYKQKTKWKLKDIKVQPNLLSEEKGVPVHLDKNVDILNSFQQSIEKWDYHVDVHSVSYLILKDLVNEWWYKSKSNFYESYRKDDVSKRSIEKLINKLKEKQYIEYSESSKINNIVPEINKNFLWDLYQAIYSIIRR